ncbi:odorant receptor 22c-like [Odontomachus brunneus]|uniref:odorant receptor 22c-like n=1 Tax=Odontomachus brunneus TaxID=486640 RepID=UPI0013F1E843|nr:odorant receptor 22c-like [Odontomachus brunneus]
MVNEIFSQVFFVQFLGSILILCSTVYYLSSHITIADFANLAVYTCCMFIQIFIYCWAGNEVILKSTGLSEEVYKIDWMLMTISERKDLLMIMKRSTRPIRFTSGFLVTLSLESYSNVSMSIKHFLPSLLFDAYFVKILFYFVDPQNILLCVQHFAAIVKFK